MFVNRWNLLLVNLRLSPTTMDTVWTLSWVLGEGRARGESARSGVRERVRESKRHIQTEICNKYWQNQIRLDWVGGNFEMYFLNDEARVGNYWSFDNLFSIIEACNKIQLVIIFVQVIPPWELILYNWCISLTNIYIFSFSLFSGIY